MSPTEPPPAGPLTVVVATGRAPLEHVGGRTLVGRIVEQLRRAGCAPGLVVCPAAQLDEVRAATAAAGATGRVVTGDDFVARELAVAPADRLLLLVDAAVVYDQRLLVHALGWTSPGALVDGASDVGRPWRSCRCGKPFAGLLALRPAQLRRALDAGRDLFDLVGLGAAPDVEYRDIEALPRYSREIRRPLRPFWQEVSTPADRDRAGWLLATAAGKGHMELLVLVVNRPVETFLCRYLSELAVTPNQLTLMSMLVGFAVIPLFLAGHLGWGLLLAVVTGILDGLDGRQARIQMKTSRLGELEHVGDKFVEIGWMLALGWFLSRGATDRWLAGATLGWVAFYFLDNGAYSWFRGRRRMMIDEATPLDAVVRVIAATRNNGTMLLVVGLVAGVVAQAFWAAVVWMALTALGHWTRALLLDRREESRWTWGERLAAERLR